MPTLSPFTGKEISSNSSMILWNLWDYIASTKLYFAVDACTGWFSSTNSACMTFPTKCSVCPLFIATTESVHAHFVFEFFFYPVSEFYCTQENCITCTIKINNLMNENLPMCYIRFKLWNNETFRLNELRHSNRFISLTRVPYNFRSTLWNIDTNEVSDLNQDHFMERL